MKHVAIAEIEEKKETNNTEGSKILHSSKIKMDFVQFVVLSMQSGTFMVLWVSKVAVSQGQRVLLIIKGQLEESYQVVWGDLVSVIGWVVLGGGGGLCEGRR